MRPIQAQLTLSPKPYFLLAADIVEYDELAGGGYLGIASRGAAYAINIVILNAAVIVNVRFMPERHQAF